MPTLESIIADTLDFVDRPDLLSPCRKVMRSILLDAHAISDFYRDLTSSVLVAGEEKNTLALPSNYRKLAAVTAYDEDDEPFTVEYTRKTLEPYVDAWGFQKTDFVYYIAGGSIVLQHSAACIPDKVGYSYYKYPTFVVAVDGSVSTDSWLCANAESYLRNKLTEFIAARTGNAALLQVAKADAQASLGILLASEMDGI